MLVPLALSIDKLDARGAFLLDDGFHFVLWLEKGMPADFVLSLFGVKVANTHTQAVVHIIGRGNIHSKKNLGATS